MLGPVICTACGRVRLTPQTSWHFVSAATESVLTRRANYLRKGKCSDCLSKSSSRVRNNPVVYRSYDGLAPG